MASTITIQGTLNWLAGLIVQRPTSGVTSALEPALTSANKVLQTILAPPFRWAWNRKEVNFSPTVAGQSDYSQAIADWGWLEKATYQISGGTPPVKELGVLQVLTSETKQNPPQKIAAVLDDNAGNITFRLMPAPDLTTYKIYLTYQKAAPLITALTGTWTPVPDRYAFLYEIGLLAHLRAIYSPQLYALDMEMFFRQLVGSAEGLTESEKNIFLEDKLRSLRMAQVASVGTQQGRQARL